MERLIGFAVLSQIAKKSRRTVPEARATQYINDERTRVTQWSFAQPGDVTGAHVHEFDYLVVPVTGGELTVVTDDGTETRMLQVAGTPYSGLSGTGLLSVWLTPSL